MDTNNNRGNSYHPPKKEDAMPAAYRPVEEKKEGRVMAPASEISAMDAAYRAWETTTRGDMEKIGAEGLKAFIELKNAAIPLTSAYMYKPQEISINTASNALDKQVSGDHYKAMPIQPVEFIHANRIGYFEGNVIKYVSRWKQKNGLADLEKAKHYIELLIELEKKEFKDSPAGTKL